MTGKLRPHHTWQQYHRRTRSRGTGSPSPGHGDRWLNDTARELNGQIYQQRQRMPGVRTTWQWHEDYLASGAQFQMSWLEYRAQRFEQWRVWQWRFGTGRYRGRLIRQILREDLAWVEWVLTNQPRGKTTRQIVEFVNRSPQAVKLLQR